MSFEYSEKALYNQLLFLQGLFDTDKSLEKLTNSKSLVGGGGGAIVGGGEEKEKLKVLAQNNRLQWESCKGIVKAYLDKSGWGWVSMDSLFGFALKAAAL